MKDKLIKKFLNSCRTFRDVIFFLLFLIIITASLVKAIEMIFSGELIKGILLSAGSIFICIFAEELLSNSD